MTIRLDEELDRLLTQVCGKSGKNRSAVIRDALRRQLAIVLFERLRRRVMPFAEARGYLTDEDVFRRIS
ncbi:MAG: CopG family transcriptional regulator [Nitrospirota bacterium]